MTGGLPKITNEAMQDTLERMKTAVAEAQTKLALAQEVNDYYSESLALVCGI